MKSFFMKLNHVSTFSGKGQLVIINAPFLDSQPLLSHCYFQAYLLMKENPNGVNPLSPENKLIFFSGPITDTRIYGSSDFFLTSSLGLNRIF